MQRAILRISTRLFRCQRYDWRCVITDAAF